MMMKPPANLEKRRLKIERKSLSVGVYLWLIIFSFLLVSCSELDKPQTETFYAQTAPPQKKEFRWSNGKMPKTFDPARAIAPPETDVVRAVFEGLTDSDTKTLKAIPAIATDWKASDDFKIWTFNLRKDAKWSNGERVTAKDFVLSWKRLAAMGERVSRPELLQNIVGLKTSDQEISPFKNEDFNVLSKPSENLPLLPNQSNSNSSSVLPKPLETNANSASLKSKIVSPVEKIEKRELPFGVEAVDNFTLKVSLVNSDKDFPALVAHPMFRPIYGDGEAFETGKLNADIVTNGAFRIFSVGQDGITLDRAEHFWNKDAIDLERVKFVPMENAEKALAAYRAGDIDAVTNADFEPLALKLLTPYEDFRRTTHGALNFYEFNQKIAPFDDVRVREALAISIERERLTDDEMDGASRPALSFLPFDEESLKLAQDAERARQLLNNAGFPDGENFPVVKLLVNRNNVQQRIARSVAKMWKQNLNVETEIVVKDSGEIKAAWESGEFALVRRNVLLSTADETANLAAIFPAENTSPIESAENTPPGKDAVSIPNENQNSNTSSTEAAKNTAAPVPVATPILPPPAEKQAILTEARAMSELPAIPLYFPTSYSLVKPYIQGFDTNFFDAPSLKNVKIDNNWQPKKPKSES